MRIIQYPDVLVSGIVGVKERVTPELLPSELDEGCINAVERTSG